MSEVFQGICSWLRPEWQVKARPQMLSEMPRAHELQLWKVFPTCRWWHLWSLSVSESSQLAVHCHRMKQWFHCPWPGKGVSDTMGLPCQLHVYFATIKKTVAWQLGGWGEVAFFSHIYSPAVPQLCCLYCCCGILGDVMCCFYLYLTCLDPTVDTPGCAVSGQALIADVCQMVVGWGSMKGKINSNISSGQCRIIPTAKILKWRNNISEAYFSPLFLLFSFLVFISLQHPLVILIASPLTIVPGVTCLRGWEKILLMPESISQMHKIL